MVTRNMLGTQCKQSHGHKWYNNLTFCATFMFCDIKRDCFDDIGKEKTLTWVGKEYWFVLPEGQRVSA